MTPAAFAAKWERITTTARASSQSHFLDLCEPLQVDKPTDVDPDGTFFTFKRAVTKAVGDKYFAWEYRANARTPLPMVSWCSTRTDRYEYVD